ncbi:MAG TPA: hypothetical protein VG845_00275 [Dehalococcoidia bacterium]|nr:hypothetical protein [Dehalococcoidia bacterium]
MKLRRQTRLKALITALTTGLFVLFLALIRTHPQISAEANAVSSPAPDYGSFFSGGSSAAPEPTASAQRPHTRTHAS